IFEINNLITYICIALGFFKGNTQKGLKGNRV
ncbi:MAG: hypothetical protein JWR54_2895, partial [Mucilaginibacter sp.]|nr:hypothetical protein [Mucilaginibacter sp.]